MASGVIDIASMGNELKRRTVWQRTPEPLSDYDYRFMIIEALKFMFIMTGRASRYNNSVLIWSGPLPVRYYDDIEPDEQEYILVSAEIMFYRKVQASVNNIVGYTTDALSVTNADKPYQYIAQTIKELEKKQRTLFYKMVRFNLM